MPGNLIYTNNQIIWDSVEGATGYIVNINGAEYYTENTYYPFIVTVGSVVKVLAVGSVLQGIESSDYTEELNLTLPLAAPTNISLSDGVISWNSVDNATGYVLVIGSGSPLNVTGTTYNVGYSYAGSLTVRVKAVDSSGLYSDSEFSIQNLVFPTLTLTTPTNLELNGSVLSFDTVALADGYEIYVKGNLYTTITSATYTVPASVLNDQSAYIEVKAVSNVHNASGLSIKLFVNLTEITNESDLINMASTGNYILTSNIALTSTWIPKDFSGMFDGNGYTISNVVITSDQPSVGFFANVDMATIKDLTITGSITLTSNSYQANVGSLAGLITDSVVEDVSLDFIINANSLNGVGNLGGVFGRIQNTNVSDVLYQGEIDAENFTVGGFAGRADNPEVINYVRYTEVDADITGTGGEQSFVGGFIGFFADNSLTISYSSAKVDVVGTSYVGGFIGYFGSGHINDSYSLGTVQAVNETLAHVGGFVGRLEGYNSTMENCISQVVVVINATGENLLHGGFAGYTLGGSFATVYTNCFYDDLDNSLDRIGNSSTGRGDGITSISISEVSTISGFDSLVWDLSGEHPSFAWE